MLLSGPGQISREKIPSSSTHLLYLTSRRECCKPGLIMMEPLLKERAKNVYILVSKGTTHHFQSGYIIDREERADHSQNLEERRYYIFAHVGPRSNENGEMFKRVNSKIRNKNQRSSSTSGGSCVNPAL